MWKRKLIFVLALTAPLCVCAQTGIRQQILQQTGAGYYLNPAQLEVVARFPPAPLPGSEVENADFATLHEWQNSRTDSECSRAMAETNPSYENFFGSISPFITPLPPSAATFFTRVGADTETAVYVIKHRYQRPRPFVVDTSLQPCIGRTNGFAYPSGHSAISRVFALILSEMVPERREEFMARADEAALDRVIAGVHCPSDVEAGKRLGDGMYEQFLKSPAFIADLELLRHSLKKYTSPAPVNQY